MGSTAGKSVTPPVVVTFDPSHKGLITLSNGNLTATGTATGWNNAVGTVYNYLGKYYDEVTVGLATATDAIGLVNPAASLTSGSAFPGHDTNGIGWFVDGRVLFNSTVITTIATWTNGSILGRAVDLDNRMIWFRVGNGNWNNSPTANPATNTGGIPLSVSASTVYAPAVSSDAIGDSFTDNFGATAFSQTPPAGFIKWGQLAPYLGNVVTRTMVPNDFSASITAMMSRKWHFIRDTSVNSIQLVIPNFWVGGPETILSGTTTITAGVEDASGSVVTATFSGSASIATTAAFVVSDPINITGLNKATLSDRIFRTNASGLCFSNWSVGSAGQPGISPGDNLNFTTATDQTAGGTITNSPAWTGTMQFGSVAIVAQTLMPSVALIGDSRCSGAGDTYDASGDLGELARSIGPSMGYVNLGVEGDIASAWTAATNRQALVKAYCSHAVIQLGVNDIFGGSTSASLVSNRAAIRSLVAPRPCLETTIPTETSSTDLWTTTANQTPINGPSIRQTFNATVRAGTANIAGFFDIASITDTSLSSSIWNADGVTPKKWTLDGIHESQFANIAIKNAGVVNTALIHRP